MRVKVHYQVSLSTTSTAAGEGNLVDLSVEGCRMESAHQLAVNTYVSLRLFIAPKEMPILVDLAAVRWVRGEACGIHFLSIQPPQVTRLQKFLASSKKSEQPSPSDDL